MWCHTVVVVLLAVSLPRGDAIKCYQCTSASDPKCGETLDTSLTPVECTPNIVKEGSTMIKSAFDAVAGALGKLGIDVNAQVPDASSAFACIKAVKQDNDKKLVIRSCSIPKLENFNMCAKLKGDSTVTSCDTCEKDSCNGASSAVPSSLLLLLTAAYAAYFFATKQ